MHILAKARAAEGPAPNGSLLDGIQSTFFAEVDRIYVACDAGFLSHWRASA